tara:strand:+ start:5214 stop:5513 length:300 start_codon:yes stop_codon:yes gene_type:complete
MQKKIEKIVHDISRDFLKNSGYEGNESINEIRLIGSSSPLDSISLVTLIVEIEEAINEEFNVEITIANEKAMSSKVSPFINLERLCSFILDEVKIAINE